MFSCLWGKLIKTHVQCFLKSITESFCSQTCFQISWHKSKDSAALYSCVFPWTSWVWVEYWEVVSPCPEALPPPWCCINAHSSWCWQCAEGKPGLKGKCWEPQEPQRTSDCSAIILTRLSCTWKGKQKNFICPIQCNSVICSNWLWTMWPGSDPTLPFSPLDHVYLVFTWGTGVHINTINKGVLAEVDYKREVVGTFHTVYILLIQFRVSWGVWGLLGGLSPPCLFTSRVSSTWKHLRVY